MHYLIVELSVSSFSAIFFGVLTSVVISLSIKVNKISKKFNVVIKDLIVDCEKNKISENTERISECTEEAILDYKEKIKNRNNSYISVLIDINASLIYNIASVYDEKSQNPHLNIRLDEITYINKYYIDIIQNLLDKKGIKEFSQIKLVKYKKIIDVIDTVKKSLFFRIYDHFVTQMLLQGYFMTMGFLNPGILVRKFVLARSIRSMKENFAVAVIEYISSDANRIYSRQIIDEINNIYGPSVISEV